MCCQALKDSLPPGKQDCVTQSHVAKEKGKEFRIESRIGSVVCRIHVDGCLIDRMDVNKCDYIMKVCDTGRLYLVELKGTDVFHAIRQILSTISLLHGFLQNQPYEGVIVSSAVPGADRNFRKEQERLRRDRSLVVTKHSFKGIIRV